MAISIQLPNSIEQQLRDSLLNLDEVAKEALLVEAMRRSQLSIGQFADLLGMSIDQADGYLKERGVMIEQSQDEYQRDLDRLRKLVL